MANYVKFGMAWTVYGSQEMELPDTVDVHDKEAVMEYLRENWDQIPIPEGEYVPGSDSLDEDVPIEVYSDKQVMRTLHFTVERTTRMGIDKVITQDEYDDFIREGRLPFQIEELYNELKNEKDPAKFDEECDYAVEDDRGYVLADWE